MTITVYAIGKHEVFEPYVEQDGAYPLYSRTKMRATGQPIHHAVNKQLGITTLAAAIELVRSGECHWRLQGKDTGQRNVFAPENIVIQSTEDFISDQITTTIGDNAHNVIVGKDIQVTIQEIQSLEDQPPTPGARPYKGLAFYEQTDEKLYFGRRTLAHEFGRDHYGTSLCCHSWRFR